MKRLMIIRDKVVEQTFDGEYERFIQVVRPKTYDFERFVDAEVIHNGWPRALKVQRDFREFGQPSYVANPKERATLRKILTVDCTQEECDIIEDILRKARVVYFDVAGV